VGYGGTFARADASTCATYIDSAGIVQTVAANVPRYLHYPTAALGPALLLEGSRTNLTIGSSAFTDGTKWSTTRATFSLSGVAPDGTVNGAGLLTEDGTAANTHLGLTFANTTVVNTLVYTTTIFAKAGGRSWFQLQEGQGVTAAAYFNLGTGTLGTVSGTGSPTASIAPVGNGWYRCRLTWTASGTAARIRVFLANGDGGSSYDGDGTSGVYFWGGQMELGAFPSSYIPTTSAAVTRAADSLSFAFPYAPQAMTVYADFVELGTVLGTNTAGLFDIGNSTDAALFLSNSGGNVYRAWNRRGSDTTATLVAAPTYGQRNELRVALAADGSMTLGQSINSAAESTATAGANALASAWNIATIQVGQRGTGTVGFLALRKIVVAAGVQSLATMRAITIPSIVTTTNALSPISVVGERAFFGQPRFTCIDTGTGTLLEATATPNADQQVRLFKLDVSFSANPLSVPIQIWDGTTLIWEARTSATGPWDYQFDFSKKPLRGSRGAALSVTVPSGGVAVVSTVSWDGDYVRAP
jgi:hypothetical protein